MYPKDLSPSDRDISLILASTSPIRRRLLEQAGLKFECYKPDFKEELDQSLSPEELALTLAEGKARAVAAMHPDAVVLGADQVGEWRGRLLGKAGNVREAREQLEGLAGDTHRLICGVVVIGPLPAEKGPRAIIRMHDETRLFFRLLTNSELDWYVGTDEWKGCAGSYRIEERGVHLLERYEGDYFNILGLPLIRVLDALRSLGVAPPFRAG